MYQTPLQKKIGQLFVIGFAGNAISEKSPIVEDISERNVGGVILFNRLLALKWKRNNIVSREQVEKLTADLQSYASTKLLIGVDQEGGKVSRFPGDLGFPTTPSAEELGKMNDTRATRQAARQTASLLASMGINYNLGPVVDVNLNRSNPVIGLIGRSFSSSSDIVSKHAGAWVEEHRKAGVLTCLKHFPGHGSSQGDSHLGFVDISSCWRDEELEPYRQLQEKQLIDSVMVAHLVNSKFDQLYPTSMSGQTLDLLLKDKLGYTGVIVSDDMQMRAITDRFGLAQACCTAIKAGVDLVIIGNNLEYDSKVLGKTISHIEREVEKGRLSEQRIDEAYKKVRTIKSVRSQKNE